MMLLKKINLRVPVIKQKVGRRPLGHPIELKHRSR